MEQIIIALITAGLGLVGVMVTNYFNNKSLSDKVTHQLEVAQAVTDTKIEDLTREENQARQAEITQEITEIVGGASALAESSDSD